jgi:Ras-related protein Rab-5C
MKSPGLRTMKVVLLGHAGSGKTCIVKQITTGTFSDLTSPTLGASYASKTISTAQGEYKLQIWDTAGQEKFRSMAPMYYRGAHAALIVYSIVDESSFTAVDSWVTSLRDNNPDADMALFLVANKIDLDENRSTSAERGEECAHSIGANYWEVSAKTGEGLDELFRNIPEAVLGIRGNTQGGTNVVPITKNRVAKNDCC